MTDKVYICPECLATFHRKGNCSNCGKGTLKDFDSYSEEQWDQLVADSEKAREER